MTIINGDSDNLCVRAVSVCLCLLVCEREKYIEREKVGERRRVRGRVCV